MSGVQRRRAERATYTTCCARVGRSIDLSHPWLTDAQRLHKRGRPLAPPQLEDDVWIADYGGSQEHGSLSPPVGDMLGTGELKCPAMLSPCLFLRLG
ncbi:MAG: hypothetical protein EBU08_10880 [Micrococcales bacterium]|nr:hypothetical protein [Micrococcales bacterium]